MWYLLGFFYHPELVDRYTPHGLKDDADVITDAKLVIELITRSRCLDVCNIQMLIQLKVKDNYTGIN